MWEEKFQICSKAGENMWLCQVIQTLSLFLRLFRCIQPEHRCSQGLRAVKKITSISAKTKEPGRNTLCPTTNFYFSCLYLLFSHLPVTFWLPSSLPAQNKRLSELLLYLWVLPEGKQAGEPGAALCVHIPSPPPCPFPLSDIKGQL